MAAIGLPVPGGFTITTEVCAAYYDNGRKYPTELKGQVEKAIKIVERESGKKFGDLRIRFFSPYAPGSRVHARDDGYYFESWSKRQDGRWPGQALRQWTLRLRLLSQFIQMYGDVVMEFNHAMNSEPEPFEHVLEGVKKRLASKSIRT